jgi:hypothetical protein
MLLGISTHFDIGRGRVARKHIVCTGSFGSTFVAAPEAAALGGAGAGGVIVSRGRAETLLALVVAGVEELEEN